jgi:dTDP-4-amino-4,6-dideoxygalactose transaminase
MRVGYGGFQGDYSQMNEIMMKDHRIIPISKPYFDEKETAAVTAVLSSGWVVQGPKVREFERAFERFQSAEHAVATTSATATLHLALLALGVGEGDEVILPAFTHPATANAIRHVRAKPVFVDIRLCDFNIDPGAAEKALTRRTKALIPVHLFGLPAEMDPILDMTKGSRFSVIEDAACGHGAVYRDRMVGTIGVCGAFSFHPRKPITTGEGGVLTTNDSEIADRIRTLRSHGESLSDEVRHQANEILYPDYVDAGFNYRMTDIQAAVGVEQVKKLPYILERRRRLAGEYNRLLSELERDEYVALPRETAGCLHSYQSYVILLRERSLMERNEVSNELQRRGIATRKGTYHVPGTRFYRETFGFKRGDFPNSEFADERSLALPLFVQMTDEELTYVVENLEGVIRRT